MKRTVVTLTGVGQCTITASQTGTFFYQGAVVQQILAVQRFR